MRRCRLARVAARDERGLARTILGTNFGTKPATPIKVTAETAARLHLVRNANLLGAREATVRDAALTSTHDVAGGGTIVQFEQRVNGIEVFRARTSVLLDADKNLVSISNGLAPGSVIGGLGKSTSFKMPGEAAVANAYAARAGIKLGADAVRDLGPKGDFRSYSVTTPGGALRIVHASAKQVYYPNGDRLVPAYYVEFLARAPRSNENQGWGIIVSAIDGSSLYQASLTQTETFNYRVWATADKIPMDGPITDKTPYPSGVPDKAPPTFVHAGHDRDGGLQQEPRRHGRPLARSHRHGHLRQQRRSVQRSQPVRRRRGRESQRRLRRGRRRARRRLRLPRRSHRAADSSIASTTPRRRPTSA